MPLFDKSYKDARGVFIVADEFGIRGIFSGERSACERAHNVYITDDVCKYSVWVIWYERDVAIDFEPRFVVLGKYPRSDINGDGLRDEKAWEPSEDGWDDELGEKTGFLP